MSRPTPKRPVGDVLSAISALRRLCLTLPHAATPEEVRRLERFERLRTGGAPLSDGDIDAVRTGLRHCWRSRDTETLLDMAARIPGGLLDRDRWLQTFVLAARALSAEGAGSASAPRG